MISGRKAVGRKTLVIFMAVFLPLLTGVQACRRRTPEKPVPKYEFNPENQPWHVAMEVGIIAAQNGKYDRAISELKRSISLNPGYAPPYAFLGLIYAK
ncbi:MAG: hypothetical protein QGH40_00340, partial [bacterium]|nr:hypothetical protein [bacterium]